MSPGLPSSPRNSDPQTCDVAVIGAGAAGLMAAIWSGGVGRRVVVLDGARTLGAKILVAGGGRCNVTHDVVDETAYAGSSPHAIRNVLAAFPVERTIRFFSDIGVELKREDTGKLFPTTDNARTVLSALLRCANEAGARIEHPWRVGSVARKDDGFIITEDGAGARQLAAARVILATGGMALPRSGSDGHGYAIARSLGHTTTPRIFPALVPLLLDESCILRQLAGIAIPATLTLVSPSGRKLREFTESVLLTHFGISGPGALDISRYYLEAAHAEPSSRLLMNFLPALAEERVERRLIDLGARTVERAIREFGLPERLADAICSHAGVPGSTSGHALKKEARASLMMSLMRHPLPVVGDRGFTHAEVTAGGVPLAEVRLSTMESRICTGLHLCGEILDVDGRIGGYNFQWAWASGYLCGRACSS